jgi:hypothetical protein
MLLPPIHPCDHLLHDDNNPTFIFTYLLSHCTNSPVLSHLFQNNPSHKIHETSPNMPLVVPGLTSNSGDNEQTNKWMNELVGKKIGDSSNETVSYYLFCKLCLYSPLATCEHH